MIVKVRWFNSVYRLIQVHYLGSCEIVASKLYNNLLWNFSFPFLFSC
jgi:hypothetical protein